MNNSEFGQKTQKYQQRINAFLTGFLHSNYAQNIPLIKAVSYSLLSGGKRIRPLLCYATAEALNIDLNQADYIAASVEMIHAYSLIHDDLPSMDDDDMRRGMQTCHIKFDEATAILAGDALQAMAFEVLSQIQCNAKTTVELIKKLSHSCGASGMAGGQALDLASENKQLDKTAMDNIHQLKTGALISAVMEMTGLLANDHTNDGTESNYQKPIKSYAYNFGMAFQIIDDVLDVIGDEAHIGKPIGSDESNNKSTYPKLIGLQASKSAAIHHSQKAIQQLEQFPGDTSYLKFLAEYLVSRKR